MTDRASLLAARLRIELAELHRTTASQRADHNRDDGRPALFTDSGYTLEYEDA